MHTMQSTLRYFGVMYRCSRCDADYLTKAVLANTHDDALSLVAPRLSHLCPVINVNDSEVRGVAFPVEVKKV